MQQPSKVYPLTLAANGTFVLGAGGDYFKLVSCTGPVHVIGDNFGALGEIEVGQGLRDVRFNWLQLTDMSGAANEIRVLIAGANFVDDRVAGVVEVVDGGRAQTLAGREFSVRQRIISAAGFVSVLQCWNPADSGVRLVVASVAAIAGAKGVTVAISTAAISAPVNNPQNKNPSYAAGVTQVCTTNNTAGNPAGTAVLQLPGTGQWCDLRAPIVCEPGYGVWLASQDQATDMFCTVQLREEPIAS